MSDEDMGETMGMEMQPMEIEMPSMPVMEMEMGMSTDMGMEPGNVEAAIEHAVEEMAEVNPIEMMESPHLEVQETDMVEEKMLANGHELREEVIETPDKKIIKVTEEGQDANDPTNTQEVKDEMTNQFKQIQPQLQPGPDEAMKIHEETHTNEQGQLEGTITIEKIHVDKERLKEMQKENPNAKIFDHTKKKDLDRLDKTLDDDVHPVATNKVFSQNEGLRAPIKIQDGDDSSVFSPQPMLEPHFIADEQTTVQKHGTVFFSLGLIMLAMVAWFYLSCKANGKRARRRDDDDGGNYRHRDPEANYKQSEMRGFGEFQGISMNDDDDDE